MLNIIFNLLFFRGVRAKSGLKKLLQSIESEITGEFLELLLNVMSLVLFIDSDFRKNIENFNGKYLFKSRDNSIKVAAIFQNNRLKVTENVSNDFNPNVTVNFKDSKALMDFIITPNPDIIGSIMKQDVVMDGNFNYVLKFAYMAKRLRLMALGSL